MLSRMIVSFFSRIRQDMQNAVSDDRGIGVVEVILILVVLIGLVVIFRDQLTTLVNGIFGRIAEDANAL